MFKLLHLKLRPSFHNTLKILSRNSLLSPNNVEKRSCDTASKDVDFYILNNYFVIQEKNSVKVNESGVNLILSLPIAREG